MRDCDEKMRNVPADSHWPDLRENWAKYAQAHLKDPRVAPRKFTKFFLAMVGFSAAYSSLALKDSDMHYEFCENIKNSLEQPDEDSANLSIWKLYTLLSGANIMNPENILYQVVNTEAELLL